MNKDSALTIEPDYINGKFHIWKNGKPIDTKLPAEVQAALMKQVVSDCCQVFMQALKCQLSDEPPGLEAMMPY